MAAAFRIASKINLPVSALHAVAQSERCCLVKIREEDRDNQFLFWDTLLKLVKAEKLPYAELVKAA